MSVGGINQLCRTVILFYRKKGVPMPGITLIYEIIMLLNCATKRTAGYI